MASNELVAGRDFERTRTALVYKRDLAFKEWEQHGQVMLELALAASGPLRYWWGDWLLYGEQKYGETYSQAVDASGYELSTLRNSRWVCGRVPPERRRENLCFGHHQLVASMEPDDQVRWLDAAVLEKWSVNDLRKAIAAEKQPEGWQPPEDPLESFLREYKGSVAFEQVRDDIIEDIRSIYDYATTINKKL